MIGRGRDGREGSGPRRASGERARGVASAPRPGRHLTVAGLPAAAVLAAILGGPAAAGAQQIPTTVPVVRNAATFAPLDLRPPDDVRTPSGAPGGGYWQQRADYEIRVRLDPKTHRVTGSETIVYTNNAPDTLRSLWLQLDQNLFRPGTLESEAVPADARFSGAFPGGGFEIASVALTRDGRRVEARRIAPPPAAEGGPEAAGPRTPGPDRSGADRLPEADRPSGATPTFRIRGTVMEVALQEPLPGDGGRIEIHLDFAFTVPERGADRMGRLKVDKGTVYQIAQWYPRMFVYDDVHGWNAMPYLGQGEFYLEYGDFDVELTLPREFVAVATGVLQNPEEVYTQEQRRRLEEARASDGTVAIIGRREVGRTESRPPGEGPLTWRFRAENVRDFAWAASEAFLLDGGAWNDVLILSAYPQEGLGEFGPGWERSTEIVRHALRHYSEKWHPYPYPVAINVAGRVVGMEYPMIVFCSVEARGDGLFGVTDHEIAHGWFPMLVGSDERRHAWMDEGFVQFMGLYSEMEYLGERSPGNPANPDIVARQMRSEAATKPVLTPPDRLTEMELGFLAYFKPAAALLLLREYVLGAERFDPAFRAYIDRWAGKHPTPADFFRTVEDVSGEELDWFWRGWLASTGRLDQAVGEVRREGDATLVTIESRGELVMPLEVRFLYADGGDDCRRIPVEAWLFGDTWTTRIVGREVRNVQIDPRGMLPDVDSGNDVWGRGIVVRRETC